VNKGQAYTVLVVALIVVCAAAWAIFFGASLPTMPAPSSTSAVSKAPPPPSADVAAKLAKSHGFQALVSYTDRGFEPAVASIKKGDTVRFTNNSTEDLWVAATGTSGAVYPGTGKECGQSAFDACATLKHGEFWEFTFDAVGTWGYKNNSDIAKTGIIHVR
jgi:plastocyanin